MQECYRLQTLKKGKGQIWCFLFLRGRILVSRQLILWNDVENIRYKIIYYWDGYHIQNFKVYKTRFDPISI